MTADTIPIHLSRLEDGLEHVKGDLPPEALDLMVEDELIHARQPLHFDLTAQLMETGILASGTMAITLDCTCARCLRDFQLPLHFPDWSVLLPLHGEDKVEIHGDCIDLIPFIREDVLLSFPQHPLCSPDCTVDRQPDRSRASLKKESPEDLIVPSPWSELDKLDLNSD